MYRIPTIWSCFFSIGLFSLSKNDKFYFYSNMRHLLLLKTFDILNLIVKVYNNDNILWYDDGLKLILGCPRKNVVYQFLVEIHWLETSNRSYLVNETITDSGTCPKFQMLISFVRNSVF
eukprot:sb/3476274/